MKNRFLLIALAIILLVVAVGCPSDKKDEGKPATEIGSTSKALEIPKDLKMPDKPSNFVSKVNNAEEAYALFAEVMNTTLGGDAWTQKEYSYNEKDALLTVKNFSVDAVNKINVEEIYLRTSLNKEELIEILTLKDWKNKPETELFNFLGFKNVEIKKNNLKKVAIKNEDLEEIDETIDADAAVETEAIVEATKIIEPAIESVESFTFNVEKLYITSLSLKEAGDVVSDNDLTAFLSILKLGKSEALNSKFTFSEVGKSSASIVVAYDETSNMEFNTKNEELNKLFNEKSVVLPEEAKILLACAMDSRTVKGLDIKMDFKNLSGVTGKLGFSLANFEMKGVSSILKGDSLSLNNLNMNIATFADPSGLDKTKDADITMSLESSNLKKYNMLNTLNDFASLSDIENPYGIFSNTPGLARKTFADLLFGAFSLESMNSKNFIMDLGGLKLKMAELNQIGPNVASTPADANATIKDMVLILPTEKGTVPFDEKDALYNFGKDFGMTEFVVNSTHSIKFDAAKETYVVKIEKGEIKDLINIKIEIAFGGLNKENIADLQKYNFANYALLFNIDSENDFDVDVDVDVESETPKLKALGNISFNGLSYRFEDLGLVDKMMAYVAVSNFQGKTSKDEVKDMAIGGLALATPGMAQYVENPSAIINSLKAFLEETKGDGKSSFEIKINPKDLTVEKIFSRVVNYETLDLLNDFKMSVSGNDKEAVDVKFIAVAS